MLAELAREEISAALDTVAGDVLAEVGLRGPPVDAFAVARSLGISVAMDDGQPGRARYVRLGGHRSAGPRAAILVNPDPRSEREHWAVAHEIGEHVAHRVFSMLGVDPRETFPNAREAVANQLAGRLLLPAEWFTADAADCDWDLIELKSRYRTASHEQIARRMLQCTPAVIVTIFDHGEVTLRRSNLPGRVPVASRLEMQCWRAVHHSGRAQRTYDGHRTIRGWPVHEPGWKREILRTEVEEIADGEIADGEIAVDG